MAEEGLDNKILLLEQELQRLRDIEAIRKLEYAYNWYLVMWMHNEIIDLFSWRSDTTLEWPGGTFLGKDGLERYFLNMNKDKDPEFMHQMMHCSGVIDIAEDGKTGYGRWWGFGAQARPRKDGIQQNMSCGIYENEYIKEDDIWKIWKIKWVPLYVYTPKVGWVNEKRLVEPEPVLLRNEEGNVNIPDWWKPDLPAKRIPYTYPSGYILPFHFKHPVTGQKTNEGELNKRVKNIHNE